MYPWKHEKWSQICKELKKREGDWNEQGWEGEGEEVLVSEERSGIGYVISTIYQSRETSGFAVSFFPDNILICAAAQFTGIASIYTK